MKADKLQYTPEEGINFTLSSFDFEIALDVG